ncbi:P2Y purinoceptor 1-like [Melanotaenia boesemani]|uniref:P2Y purinoceptor 1-like n=1 Tax=Melanotaenia boesemani TaxID=1250792 RepID=UPI001C058143|nr:P2Y purinoceptor 1-like [Melanotaenia boesemani]
MNKTNHTSNFEFYQNQVLPALYFTTFIIGLFTNGWGCRTLWQKWKKLGNINVFVLNLGLVNILFLPILPFFTFYYLRKEWIFGSEFCKVTRFCFNLNLYCSIGFLTCISVYRYLAIVHPMRVKGRLTVTHSVAISVLVWLLVSIQSLPDTSFPKILRKNTTKCYHTTTIPYVEDYLKYSLVWTVTGFFIPFLINVGCYGHVTLVLCHSNNIDKVLKQKSLRLLFILTLLFCVCYIPHHVLKNLTLYARVLRKRKIYDISWENDVFKAHQVSRGLVCLNSALNPLVCLRVSQHIPASIRNLFLRVHQMISVTKTDEDL